MRDHGAHLGRPRRGLLLKPRRPRGSCPTGTAPSHGSPSPSRSTSSGKASVPRRWTPATTSPSPPSGASPVMPRSSRPSSAPSARCSTSAHASVVTAAIWKALVLRDQHCRFPGCRQLLACRRPPPSPWADGGGTLANLVLLCRAHHTLLHATPWEVRLNPVDRGPEFHPPPSRRRGRSTGSVPRGSDSSDYRSSSSSTSSCALVSPGLHPDPDRSHGLHERHVARGGSSARTRCADAPPALLTGDDEAVELAETSVGEQRRSDGRAAVLLSSVLGRACAGRTDRERGCRCAGSVGATALHEMGRTVVRRDRGERLRLRASARGGRLLADYAFFPLYPAAERFVSTLTGLAYPVAGVLLELLL